MRLHQGLRHVIGLDVGQVIEILFELLLGLLGGIVGDGDVAGAPVSAVEDGGGADVEEDDGVAAAEVVLDGPFDGVGALVAEVDGDGDFALGVGGGCGGLGEARGGRLDCDRFGSVWLLGR